MNCNPKKEDLIFVRKAYVPGCQPQEAKSPAKEVPSLKVNNKFVTLFLHTRRLLCLSTSVLMNKCSSSDNCNENENCSRDMDKICRLDSEVNVFCVCICVVCLHLGVFFYPTLKKLRL
jgi:hypothetical protein